MTLMTLLFNYTGHDTYDELEKARLLDSMQRYNTLIVG